MRKIILIVFALACAAVLLSGEASAQQNQSSANYWIMGTGDLANRLNYKHYGPGYREGYSIAGREHLGYPASPLNGGGGYQRPVGVNVYRYSGQGVPPPYVRFNRQRYATYGGYGNGSPQMVRRPSPGRNAYGCFGSDRIGPDGKCASNANHESFVESGPGPMVTNSGNHYVRPEYQSHTRADPILGLVDSACVEYGGQAIVNGGVHECMPAHEME